MKLLSPEFKLRSSLVFGVFFLFIHGGAISGVCLTCISWWLKVALTCCILMNLIVVMKREVLRNSDQSISKFWYEGYGRWWLKKKSGKLIAVVISYPVFISNVLIVTNFITIISGKKISLPVFRDALSRDDFRRLKMVLKTV
jgi:hypothetical protein